MTLPEVQRLLVQAERAYERRVGELQAVVQTKHSVESKHQLLEQQAQALEEASVFLTSFAEEAQQAMQHQVETLVTYALQVIFDDGLSFKIVADTKARNSTLDFVIASYMDGVEVETPVMGSRGGGVAAVVGFLLRLVVVMLTPGRRRAMFLDESFAQVSEEYEGRVAEFLRELVDKAGMQIVLVTHSAAYSDVADKSYRFSQDDGVTVVAEV